MKLIILICFACLGSAYAQTNADAVSLDLASDLLAFRRTGLKTTERTNLFLEMSARIGTSEESFAAFNSEMNAHFTNHVAPMSLHLSRTNLGPVTFTNSSKAKVSGVYLTEIGMTQARFKPASGSGGGYVKLEALPDEVKKQLGYNPIYGLGWEFKMFRVQKTLAGMQADLKDLQSRVFELARSTPKQMPTNVAAEIKADAIRRWPSDYEMQEFVIKQQTEAWHRLND